MVFIGFMVWIGNLLLGTRQALLLGIIAGLMELIPNIGPIIATIPAVILALIFGSSHFDISNTVFALVVVIFYVLIQILENQVVVPKILGDAVDLPPLVVIIGVTIGGATIGILGVFLATPVISTGKAVFMYLYNKILEPPPEAAPPEEKPSFLDRVRNLTGKIKLPWRRKAEA
jgi:predicted PurR-regulated permease PerM